MAPPPILSAYLFRPIRRPRSAEPSVRGSAVRERALASVAGRVREGERGPLSLDRDVWPRL